MEQFLGNLTSRTVLLEYLVLRDKVASLTWAPLKVLPQNFVLMLVVQDGKTKQPDRTLLAPYLRVAISSLTKGSTPY